MDKRYSRQEIGKRITERLSSVPTEPANKPKASTLARLKDLAVKRRRPMTTERL